MYCQSEMRLSLQSESVQLFHVSQRSGLSSLTSKGPLCSHSVSRMLGIISFSKKSTASCQSIGLSMSRAILGLHGFRAGRLIDIVDDGHASVEHVPGLATLTDLLVGFVCDFTHIAGSAPCLTVVEDDDSSVVVVIVVVVVWVHHDGSSFSLKIGTVCAESAPIHTYASKKS